MTNASRSTLRTQVLGHQFSSTQYSDFVNQVLDEGQLELAREMDFRVLFDTEAYTTTSGDNTYDLPSDYLRLHSVRNTNTSQLGQLTQLQVEDFDDLDTTTTGQPTHYAIDGSALYLYPTPDAVYSISLRHYRKPTAYTDDNAVSEIPNSDKALRLYCLAKCFGRENDLTQATYYESQWAREKQKLAGEAQDDTNDATQAEVVPGMWDDGGTGWPSVTIPR